MSYRYYIVRNISYNTVYFFRENTDTGKFSYFDEHINDWLFSKHTLQYAYNLGIVEYNSITEEDIYKAMMLRALKK